MKTSIFALALAGVSNAVDITVSSSGGKPASPYQYGTMFEDINQCGDGGLYAELIRNRAFQATSGSNVTLIGYSAVGGAKLSISKLSGPLSSALPNSLNVAAANASASQVGFANSGYWGIPVSVQTYTGSFYVRGSYNGVFTASLRSSLTNEEFASAQIRSRSTKGEWTQHEYTLLPTKAAANVNNTLQIAFDPKVAIDGSLDFNLISLFPPTYKDRENGLRKDLMEALADLKPTFLRFPGGNDLEGNHRGERWVWNETIGPLENRPGKLSTWGYQETGGLGLIEYMHWCEDLEMEPILAVWDGLSLDSQIVTEADLQPYIDEALDLIEFLTGTTSTKQGALRASLGYAKPWKLKFVEVGNEDGLNNGTSSYSSYRFSAFLKAINAKYPDITVLASVPSSTMTISPPAGADYHDYTTPDDFVKKFTFFDNLKVPTLVGEYANVYWNNANGVPWGQKFPTYPWWIGSIAEAVFLIGAERNSGLSKVIGTTYAPTFMNVNSYQWSPTLLAFSADPAKTTHSTSHHVISMIGATRATHILPTTSNTTFGPLYYVAGVNNETGSHIFKAAVYNSTADVPVNVGFPSVDQGTKAALTILSSNDPFAWNTHGGANVVQANETTLLADASGTFRFSMPALSVALLKTL